MPALPPLLQAIERQNRNMRRKKKYRQKIELMTYGVISGYSVDPVEKKPLYHFFPGSNIFSIGSYGCNMRCDFCQNYHISQNIPNSIIQAKQSIILLKMHSVQIIILALHLLTMSLQYGSNISGTCQKLQ